MLIRNITKTKCEVSCDTCETVFEKYISQCGDLHFCCRACISKAKETGGKIFEKIKKTTQERYGTDNVFKSDTVKQKIRDVLKERYGADNPLKVKFIAEKVKNTCLQRYGTDNPAKSQIVKEKERKTYQQKSDKEMIAILEKRIATNNERYGVSYPMQSNEVKSKFDWAAAYKKSIETKRNSRTGSYSSKIEILVGEILKDLFGKENILAQVKLNNRWTVDFYIVSMDVYLQIDGTYWHGLNRPLEVIKEMKSSKDRRILQTYLKDREQDTWAVQNGIELVRITDEEINTWQKKNEINQMILQRLSQRTQ